MNHFFTILETVSFSLGLLITGILLMVNRNGDFAKHCLALFMGLHTLYALILTIFYNKLLLYAPYLLPVINAFTLLTYPIAYIYVRASLYEEPGFRKSDWLLAAPTVVFLLFLIPYFKLSLAEQQALLLVRYANNGVAEKQLEGLFPRYVFSFFRVGWSGFFIWKSIRLIKRFQNDFRRGSHRAAMLQWLKSFTRWLALIVVLALPVLILASLLNFSLAYADFVIVATMMYLMFQLFKRPGLLYNFQYSPHTRVILTGGRQEEIYRFQPAGDRPAPTTAADEEEEDQIRLQNLRAIHNRLIENQSFLDSGYSLEQLAADTNLPRYLVSSIINQEYGMGFRDLLNYHRVQYFIHNYGIPEWSRLTLEAIGRECGFGNRSSFSRNFKLVTGSTPSEYLKGKAQKPA